MVTFMSCSCYGDSAAASKLIFRRRSAAENLLRKTEDAPCTGAPPDTASLPVSNVEQTFTPVLGSFGDAGHCKGVLQAN